MVQGTEISAQQKATPPGFLADGKSFHFLGGFIPGWHFGKEDFHSEINLEILKTARENGINALHIMMPEFENPRGNFIEQEVKKLDSFIYMAGQEGIYILPEIIQGVDIANNGSHPFYHPQGIQGIIQDSTLKQAFRNRISMLVNRVNTLSGIPYKEDPAIMAWILVGEPLSAPWNYGTPPDISLQEFKDWIEETAAFVKSMDPNHLVTIFTTGGIGAYYTEWTEPFNVPSLDFIYAEDADMRALNYFPQLPAAEYPLPLLALRKPLVIGISFTSGVWNGTNICGDTSLQTDLLRQALDFYESQGITGQIIQSWGSAHYPWIPDFAPCFNYNSSWDSLCGMFQAFATKTGTLGWPGKPLPRVEVQPAGMKLFPEIDQIKVYPNPTEGSIYIETDELVFAEIYSYTGTKLIQTDKRFIDLSSLKPGIYFLVIYNCVFDRKTIKIIHL
jgi:hypothetical protein